MPATKPATALSWSTNANFAVGHAADIGQPTKVAPPAGNIAEGFNPGYGLPSQWINYLWNLAGQWTAYLRDFEDIVHSFTVQQIFGAGLSIAASYIVGAYDGVTWAKVLDLDGSIVGASGKIRLYVGDGKWCLTLNAFWTNGTAKWASDANAKDSFRLIQEAHASGLFAWHRKAATAATWNDNAWTVNATISNTGAVSATTVDTSGDITSQDFVVALDGVRATAGNVSAEGDPASDQGRLKGLQIVSTGSAPTAAAGAAMGGGASNPTVTGNDVKGNITLTTSAAGGGPIAGIITTVTFNKAYPSAPVVIVQPTNQATADLGWSPLYIAASTTTFTMRTPTTPGAAWTGGGGTPYGWSFAVVG